MKNTIEKHKVVQSGDFVEFITYHIPESPVVKDFSKKSVLSDSDKLSNRVSYLSICRKRVERLIWCNPDLNRFITLTFSANIVSYDSAMREFNLFIKRLRYHAGGKHFKYIASVEFQKRGAIHFHLLVNSYIPNDFLKKTWGCGHIDIRMSRGTIKNRVYYMTKYMNKNTAKEKRLWGRRSFVASYNLKKPLITFYSSYWGAIEYLNRSWRNMKVICKNHYVVESSFLGDIDVRQYILTSASRKVLSSV